MPYDQENRFVSMAAALDSWSPHAVALLEDTARKYNGFVTYKQLGEHVQEHSGISHKASRPVTIRIACPLLWWSMHQSTTSR